MLSKVAEQANLSPNTFVSEDRNFGQSSDNMAAVLRKSEP